MIRKFNFRLCRCHWVLWQV